MLEAGLKFFSMHGSMGVHCGVPDLSGLLSGLI